MDDTLYSRRYTVAASHAAPFFAQTIADYIQFRVDRSGNYGIVDVVTWGLLMAVLTSNNPDLPPRSIDDFLLSMKEVLSSDAFERIRS